MRVESFKSDTNRLHFNFEDCVGITYMCVRLNLVSRILVKYGTMEQSEGEEREEKKPTKTHGNNETFSFTYSFFVCSFLEILSESVTHIYTHILIYVYTHSP